MNKYNVVESVKWVCGHKSDLLIPGRYTREKRSFEWMKRNGMCDECASKLYSEKERKEALSIMRKIKVK